jgi:hypothetical protein
MFTSTTYGSVADPLAVTSAKMILQSNTEENVACLSCPSPPAYTMIPGLSGRMIHTQGPAVILYFLACSANIAEGSYYRYPRKMESDLLNDLLYV